MSETRVRSEKGSVRSGKQGERSVRIVPKALSEGPQALSEREATPHISVLEITDPPLAPSSSFPSTSRTGQQIRRWSERTMRNILLGTVGATALAYAVAWGGAAVAGGYSPGAMPGPGAAPFEGFTIGLGLGYSTNDTTASPKGFLAAVAPSTGGSYEEGGVKVSAELRYLHALSQTFYVGAGLEGFYDGSEPSTGGCGGTTGVSVTCSSSDAWGADLVAIAGADLGGALVTVKGGYTLADYEDKAVIANTVTISEDGWNGGWLVGGGVETHITDSMTIGLEADYRWMDERNFELLGLTGDLAGFETEKWTVGVKLRSGF